MRLFLTERCVALVDITIENADRVIYFRLLNSSTIYFPITVYFLFIHVSFLFTYLQMPKPHAHTLTLKKLIKNSIKTNKNNMKKITFIVTFIANKQKQQSSLNHNDNKR